MDTSPLKTCYECQIPQMLSAFNRNKNSTDGRRSQCRACQKKESVRYHASHKQQARDYYIAHRETIIARSARSQAMNPKAAKARKKKWASLHPEVHRAKEVRRRANKRNAPLNDLTAEQFAEIQAAYNFRCVYCPPNCWRCAHKRHKLTIDHITPLIAGGSNTVHNIVPACLSCNVKKHKGPAPVPIQPLLLTIAPCRSPRASS